jgi:hypothetical protein
MFEVIVILLAIALLSFRIDARPSFHFCIFAFVLGLMIEQLPLYFPLKILLVIPSTLLFFGLQKFLCRKDRKRLKLGDLEKP